MVDTERWTTVETSRWPKDVADFFHRCWLVRRQIAMASVAFVIWAGSAAVAELLKDDIVVRRLDHLCRHRIVGRLRTRRPTRRSRSVPRRDRSAERRRQLAAASRFRVELRTVLYETADSTTPMRTETTMYWCEDF